jgi:hypothetical protein
MNINVNRQFVLLDFELIDDPSFLDFVSAAEFGTYLILRRFIWRGGEDKPHFLNLHNLYEKNKLLVSSISNEKLASLLKLNDRTRVSKQLTKLEKYGVIKRIRTGRQNIYVLGEWYDYSEGKDGSKRLEWFYLEQKFGVSKKADLAQKAKSELHPQTGQTWLKEPNINIEENREENTVNGVVKGEEKSTLQKLPDLGEPPEKTDYVAKQILKALGAALSTCVEMLPRPISMRPHNKTASKHRIRKRRSWVDVLTARPAMTMLKGLGVRG